jgi:hypothetical protein
MKRNLMKEAHKLTKEIKEQYPEVDYQAQLGLCLSFLAQEGEQEMKLQGTEKQIKYAESLRGKEISKLQKRVERKMKKDSKETTTYKIRKTGEKLELTDVEAIQLSIQILNNMTKAWEVIDACSCNTELIIYHFGQYR